MHIKVFIIAFFISSVFSLFAQDTSKQKIVTQDLFKNNNRVVIDDSKPVIKKNSSNPYKDSVAVVKKDSVIFKPKHDPHKATLYSLILPGFGQAYNHEYWKIPIVYAAISIPVITFIYNNNWYHRTSSAFNILVNNDTANFGNIYYSIKPLINDPYILQNLQNARNGFRKDRDYSILFFLLGWALNVVDATVFGNLKGFDVSDNISMNISPTYNSNAKTAGLGFVFNLKTPQKKLINLGN